ncbi:MAG TPA: dTMP kinase [Chloroflexota bacterium]
MRGRFIVLEGLDGSGISTQARRLAGRLDRLGVPYFCTREPTDGPVGSMVRLALTGRLQVDPTTLALMYAADRSDHVHGVVRPRLEKGIHVVSERHVLSSLAYQGGQLGDLDWVRAINRESMRAVTPDLTVFLDLAPEAALGRIDAARPGRELFESPDRLAATRVAFQRAIAELRAGGARVEVVDAAGSIDAVEQQIADLVSGVLPAGKAPEG